MNWRRVLVSATVLGVVVLPAPARAAEAELEVFAGIGESQSFSGDGGPATAAALHDPTSVAVGADGTVYIADSGNRAVRAVGADGVISTVAGIPGDPGAVTPLGAGQSKPATEFRISPTALAVGSDGVLYIADGRSFQIFVLGADGRLSLFAGTGQPGFSGDGGPAVEARIGAVRALAVAADGTVYLGDVGAPHRVRAVAPDGTIDTIAGNGSAELIGGGPALQVGLPSVTSLAVDPDRTLWVTSSVLQRVADGQLRTAHRLEGDRWELSEAGDPLRLDRAIRGTVAVHGTNRYVLDDDALRSLGTDGTLRTVAEVPGNLGPFAVGGSGHAYLVDPGNDRIWRVDVSGGGGDEPDGGAGTGSPRWWAVGTMAALLLAVAGVVVVVLLRRRRKS